LTDNKEIIDDKIIEITVRKKLSHSEQNLFRRTGYAKK